LPFPLTNKWGPRLSFFFFYYRGFQVLAYFFSKSPKEKGFTGPLFKRPKKKFATFFERQLHPPQGPTFPFTKTKKKGRSWGAVSPGSSPPKGPVERSPPPTLKAFSFFSFLKALKKGFLLFVQAKKKSRRSSLKTQRLKGATKRGATFFFFFFLKVRLKKKKEKKKKGTFLALNSAPGNTVFFFFFFFFAPFPFFFLGSFAFREKNARQNQKKGGLGEQGRPGLKAPQLLWFLLLLRLTFGVAVLNSTPFWGLKKNKGQQVFFFVFSGRKKRVFTPQKKTKLLSRAALSGFFLFVLKKKKS